MVNKYRLSSKSYYRETPNEQITPRKIYFISVEGVATEVEYLQGLSDYRTELGINALVNIEVLRRKTKDGYSAPEQVIELLEEYLSLREAGNNIFPDIQKISNCNIKIERKRNSKININNRYFTKENFRFICKTKNIFNITY